MGTIRIKTRLESETLVLPEIRPLIGKNVEISVTEEPKSPAERLLDTEYHAECEADTSPEVSLDEVRSITSKIPGSMSAEVIADRDERL
jgi:hypothetical protein